MVGAGVAERVYSFVHLGLKKKMTSIYYLAKHPNEMHLIANVFMEETRAWRKAKATALESAGSDLELQLSGDSHGDGDPPKQVRFLWRLPGPTSLL